MKYIIEFNGRAIKEYARKESALSYARRKAKNKTDDYDPVVTVWERIGRCGNVIWSNSPIV